jgi:spore coat protein CotH
MTCRLARSLWFATLVLCLHDGTARAQSTDELFDPATLQEIRLFLNSRDLQLLQEQYQENTYYTADLQWRGQRVRNIGVRVRGTASRSQTKPGLQLDFDRYVTAQRFLGLRSLVLDNLWQDPSMIRETVAMAFFARMGYPAPRESFARVYINDAFFGLYAIVETVDDLLVSKTMGESGAYVYELKNVSPYYFDYLGDDYEPYKERFEPRAHKLESDAALYGPLRDLVREVNEPDDAVWRERVARHIDLAELVRYVAIETFLAEVDGMLGANGMSNMYFVRPSADAPHRLIPWDKDLAFSDSRQPLFQRMEENVLVRRALAFDDLRAQYLDVLEACARSALSGGWLRSEVNRQLALIGDVGATDTRKPYSDEQTAEAITVMRRFAVFRPFFILSEVASARAR